mmetsp:Transcript_3391/g.6343  ORF Transcript_3391/g.6343 Transcript_3391/m.6343 type:complete len:510 (+) Transcript_3391:4656-6185(+)
MKLTKSFIMSFLLKYAIVFVLSALLSSPSWLVVVAADTITRSLEPQGKISVVMYDFDRTLVTSSYGEAIILQCDPACSYASCECTGVDQLTNYLTSNVTDPQASVISAFGGQRRVDQLQNHLQKLADADISFYVVSTSWYLIPAAEWAKFIYAALEIAGLEGYFPLENIISLDDPGEDIPANKGAAIRTKLSELNLLPSDAIFVDDSQGNFLSAVGNGNLAAETIYVQPRTGMSNTSIAYIESRCLEGTRSTAPGPFTTTITRNLVDERPITVLMYDFDRTLVIESFGEKIILACDPTCSYMSCDCTGPDQLSNYLLNNITDPSSAVLATFGGQDRLNRLKLHFQRVTESDKVSLYFVSTSWYSIPKEEWAKFILTTLKLAGLDEFFSSSTASILSLDDPGDGIPANKGVVVRSKIQELELTAQDAIFADDSQGNFLSSVHGGNLAAETIYVQPRTGLSDAALAYMENRVVKAEPPTTSSSDAHKGLEQFTKCLSIAVTLLLSFVQMIV